MKKIILFIPLVLFIAFTSLCQGDAEYGKKLRKLFEVSGTEATYNTAISQTITMFKGQYTDVDAELWDRIEQEFLLSSIDDLTTLLIPVYNKHLTAADLDGLISFYQSDVGKKYAKKTPLIVQESMQVGQEWGMKIGQELQKKLEKEGY